MDLGNGAKLTRCGKHRVLQVMNGVSAADGTIATLSASDRPGVYVQTAAVFRGQTGDYFISITPSTGKVGFFKGANAQVQCGGYIVACADWYVD